MVVAPNAEIHRMSETLGEVKGQLRELIHTINNTAQKLDAMSERVTSMRGVPERITAIEVRLTALETERNRRDGATGIIGAIMKSPVAAWLVLLGAGAWAVITGKVHS